MNRAAKVILFLFFLLVASVAVAGYFFWQYRQTKELADNPTQAEVERVVDLVAQHVVLPEETPTVATVTSVEELRDQPFFKNAQNGYQVLVYQQTGLAVLYDPNNDRVVNMAQINPIPVDSADVVPETPTEDGDTSTDTEDTSAQQTDETVVQ